MYNEVLTFGLKYFRQPSYLGRDGREHSESNEHEHEGMGELLRE